MNLLNNLLEFSQPTSSFLSFCQSPTNTTQQYPSFSIASWQPSTNPSANISNTTKKETDISLEKRPTSKSVSKMTLFSLGNNPNTFVNTKQKILHRLFHKLNMKVHKYYYQFFVSLQNFKNKKAKPSISEKKAMTTQNLQNAISKLQQLQQILFSKHFEHYLKKHSLKMLRDVPKQRALAFIAKIFNKKLMLKSYKRLMAYSEQLCRNQIRLEILSSSMQQIYSVLKRQRLQLSFLIIKNNIMKKQNIPLQSFPQQSKMNMIEIESYQINNKKPSPEKVNIEEIITKKSPNKVNFEEVISKIKSPHKINIEEIIAKRSSPQKVNTEEVITREFSPKLANYQDLNKNTSSSNKVNIQEICLDTQLSQQYKMYKKLKKNRQSLRSSPVKACEPINPKVVTTSYISGIKGPISFGKAVQMKKDIQEKSFNLQIDGPQIMYQISKRIQADTISRKEIQDLNSKCIFVNSIFDSTMPKDEIVESKVNEYHPKKLYTDSSLSQLTLIDQFSDISDGHKGTLSNKSSRFGTEAVNFKNSLIYERETVNPHHQKTANHHHEKNKFLQISSNFSKNKQPQIQHENLFVPFSSGYQYQSTRYSPQKDYSNVIMSSENKQERNNAYSKVLKHSENEELKAQLLIQVGRTSLNSVRKGPSFGKERRQFDGKRNSIQDINPLRFTAGGSNLHSVNYFKSNY